MATTHPDETKDAGKKAHANEPRPGRQDDDEVGKPATGPSPSGDPRRDQRRDDEDEVRDDRTVDPANDPYSSRNDPRGDDPERLPSSALNPQDRHDRDIEDLKAAGHDFAPKKLDWESDPDAKDEDPQLRDVTAEEQRTRREDGLEVPMPPPRRSNLDDPKHPLRHLKGA